MMQLFNIPMCHPLRNNERGIYTTLFHLFSIFLLHSLGYDSDGLS